MKENENLFDKIKEIIGSDASNFTIMEEIIDMNLQAEYFEYSNRISKENDDVKVLKEADMLFKPGFSIDEKKRLLTRLASVDDVAAYRIIESYLNNPEKELFQWGRLALQESRMHLRSSLLEENQIIISTGLGGKEDKLRYFVVLISKENKDISSFQSKIIKSEIPYLINKFNGEVEEILIQGFLVSFLMLLPIQHTVKKVLREAIIECNLFGNFLQDNCIITNVKKLTFDEIIKHIEEKSVK